MSSSHEPVPGSQNGTNDAKISSSKTEELNGQSPEFTPQQQNKIKSLESSMSKLQMQISQTESLLSETRERLNALSPSDPPEAHAVVKRHIKLLHEYNEIKDIGQGLMGLIADSKGMRYVDIQTEFGIVPSD